MCDIWRLRNPEARQYTWCRDGINKNSVSASRIDMLLVSNSQADCVENCNISVGYKTDHSLVDLDITMSNFEWGPGIWKLNEKHLLNEDYVKIIKEVIARTIQDTPLLTASQVWSEIIQQCAKASKIFSKKVATENKEYANSLIHLKSQLTSDRLCNPGNDQITTSLNQVQQQIDNIEKIKVESAIFRSRCEWAEHGEKMSKKFFALEKQNYLHKNMKCVITECGKHITDQKGILKEQTKFFKSLYQKDSRVNFNLKRDSNEKFLTNDEKELCDAPLTIDELYDGLMTLKTGVCPGSDGLGTAFYQKFWKDLAHPFTPWH